MIQDGTPISGGCVSPEDGTIALRGATPTSARPRPWRVTVEDPSVPRCTNRRHPCSRRSRPPRLTAEAGAPRPGRRSPRASAAAPIRRMPPAREVLELGLGIDPHRDLEGRSLPSSRVDAPPWPPARDVMPAARPRDRERLRAGEPQRWPPTRPRRTAAAGRPCPPGSIGGCARSSPPARTGRPTGSGPFAAQSRLEPLPYSLPASTPSGVPSLPVAHGGVEDAGDLAVGRR